MPLRKVNGGGGLIVSLRLSGKHVLVIGGGKEAVGRIFFSLEADAIVTLIAPLSSVHPDVLLRIQRNDVRHIDREYQDKIDMADLKPDLVLGNLSALYHKTIYVMSIV